MFVVSPSLKHGDLGPLVDYNEGRVFLLRKFAIEKFLMRKATSLFVGQSEGAAGSRFSPVAFLSFCRLRGQ